MFSKKIRIELEKKDDIFHLEPLGDIHVGHAGFDEHLYKTRVRAITKAKNRYTLFMGDQIDAITVYDKRFNPDMSLEHDIDNQREKFQKLTQPLFDAHKKSENEKIWGLLHGNHEYKIPQVSRAYLENLFCRPNGIDFLGAKCYIALEVRYNKKILAQWEIMAMHGSGGGRPERMLQQMKQNNYMDIFLCGHLHQKYYKPEESYQLDFRTGKVWRRPTHLANTGTFCHFIVEGTSGYGDQKNEIISTPLGTATLSFNAEEEKIVGHI